MGKKIKFIDTIIRNIKPRKARTVYWFEEHPGFGLRVTPSGHKSFVYKYMSGRTSRWMTIGKYPQVSSSEARKEYLSQYEAVSDYGRDPIDDAQKLKSLQRPLESLIEDYFDIGRIKGNKHIREEQRYFERDIIPVIGDKPIQEITADDIDTIQKNIIRRATNTSSANRNGRVAAKQAVGCIKRVLNLALKKGLIPNNPALLVEPLGQNGKRDRVLTFEEIWFVWHGLTDNGAAPVTGYAIKFMLATMQRGIEVRNMKYRSIVDQGTIWQLEKEETKSGRLHRVPLNIIAKSIIDEARHYTGNSHFVFGACRALSRPDTPYSDLKPPLESTYSRALLRCRRNLGIRDIRPHDLRRTGATWITAMGLPKLYARLMLNHSDGDRDVTGEIYIQYGYDVEKRKASDVWAFVLEHIINAPTPDDIPTLDDMRASVRERGLLA